MYWSSWESITQSSRHQYLCELESTSFGTHQSIQSNNQKYLHKGVLFKLVFLHFVPHRKSFWIRAIRGEYLPVVSLDNPLLRSYVRSMKISLNKRDTSADSNTLQVILDWLRQQAYKCHGTIFTGSIIASALILILANSLRENFKQNKCI